jgi:methylase of polypeptide subunit release factors
MTISSRTLRALGANKLAEHSSVLFTSGPGIFQPTATTAALLQATLTFLSKKQKMLDLGCGWGIIGLETKLDFPNNVELYMSDSSPQACVAANKNAETLDIEVDVRQGSIFEPWRNETFDLIVSDVSGVSNEVPMLNNWFEGIPCDTGKDGLDLVSQVIIGAPQYLATPESVILMPLISLSNVKRAENLMDEYYSDIDLVNSRNWSLDIVENSVVEKMDDLMRSEKISFKRDGSRFDLYTNIYQLSNPKKH